MTSGLQEIWVYLAASPLLALTFSPDSRILLTGCQDGTAQLWDVATGKPRGQAMRHSGMVMAAVGLLGENADPSEREIREGLEGNLCRCTGYHNIVRAVRAAARAIP